MAVETIVKVLHYVMMFCGIAIAVAAFGLSYFKDEAAKRFEDRVRESFAVQLQTTEDNHRREMAVLNEQNSQLRAVIAGVASLSSNVEGLTEEVRINKTIELVTAAGDASQLATEFTAGYAIINITGTEIYVLSQHAGFQWETTSVLELTPTMIRLRLPDYYADGAIMRRNEALVPFVPGSAGVLRGLGYVVHVRFLGGGPQSSKILVGATETPTPGPRLIEEATVRASLDLPTLLGMARVDVQASTVSDEEKAAAIEALERVATRFEETGNENASLTLLEPVADLLRGIGGSANWIATYVVR